jgi:hypothetical protein
MIVFFFKSDSHPPLFLFLDKIEYAVTYQYLLNRFVSAGSPPAVPTSVQTDTWAIASEFRDGIPIGLRVRFSLCCAVW